MNKIRCKRLQSDIKVVAVLLFILTACYNGLCSTEVGEEDVKVSKVSLADPFILLYKGTYYAYGTASPRGIEVYISDDLKKWRRPDNLPGSLALDKNDSYGDSLFWAPEVYYVNKRFYMYYSAQRQICVATADSPLGPFKQNEKKPMYDKHVAIDNSLFIDNGKAYMYFVALTDPNNPGSHFIYVAELEDDLLKIKEETIRLCFGVTQPWWENMDHLGITEGPFVIKYNNRYWMTYSGNGYDSPDYAIGFATADHPMGPWIKYKGNPIFRRPGKLLGVGHSAIFTDKDGQLRKVFHSWKEPDPGKIHPRIMHITNVYFEEMNGNEIMAISSGYLTPECMPSEDDLDVAGKLENKKDK